MAAREDRGGRWPCRVHPRVVQALARHAKIDTTMRAYVDVRLLDLRGAVEAPALPRPVTRATRSARPPPHSYPHGPRMDAL